MGAQGGARASRSITNPLGLRPEEQCEARRYGEGFGNAARKMSYLGYGFAGTGMIAAITPTFSGQVYGAAAVPAGAGLIGFGAVTDYVGAGLSFIGGDPLPLMSAGLDLITPGPEFGSVRAGVLGEGAFGQAIADARVGAVEGAGLAPRSALDCRG